MAIIHALCLRDGTVAQLVHVRATHVLGAGGVHDHDAACLATGCTGAGGRIAEVDAVLREWKRCPTRAEAVRVEARVCFLCRRDIDGREQ